jgi:hypothetical protein
MDVHKPKPFHGWREFLKEVGIIVLGVLIALSAEQIVETLHWQHKMHDLRAAMTNELTGDDAPEAYFRLATHDCLERYLDNLQTVAEAGGERTKLAALAGAYPGYGPALLTWDMEGWRSFLAADGAAHMPPDELTRWSLPYIAVPELQHYAQDEREAIGQLQSIRPAPGPMSPQELDALAHALQRLRTDNDWIQNYATFFFSGLQRAGQKLDSRAMQSLYRSHALALFQPSLEAAHLGGCAVTPDLADLRLRVAPSMPQAPAAASPP